MPPKPKYTRDMLVNTALQVVRAEGIEALTARRIGRALNAAPSSVFTHVSAMEELAEAVTDQARAVYDGYVERGLLCRLPFKGFGREFIRFAEEEPQLFRLLFMRTDHAIALEEHIFKEGHRQIVLEAACNTFGITEQQAYLLYRTLWLQSYGMAVMVATRTCRFSEEEILSHLGMACRGMLASFALPADDRVSLTPSSCESEQGTLDTYIHRRAMMQ